MSNTPNINEIKSLLEWVNQSGDIQELNIKYGDVELAMSRTPGGLNVAAPVAAFVYGGTAGVGTGALVSLFREMGQSLIASVTTQAFISDPIDKVIVMLIGYFTVKALPKKTVNAFAPHEGLGSKGAIAATA